MSNNKEFIMKPKVDFCFKELMEEADVRKGFIAALLNVQPEEVTDTQLLPTHLRREHEDEKLGILDVKVLLNREIKLDVEIQISPYKMWAERSLFYLCKVFTDQMHPGDNYSVLGKCIHVGILDFVLFKDVQEYYSRFHFWEDARHSMYTDKLEIHTLELPKLSQCDYPETTLLKWTRFINAQNKEEMEMAAKSDEYVNKAYERLLHISADEQKRLEYEAREKAIRDHNSLLEYNLQRGYEEGYGKGYGTGYDSGYDTGRKEAEESIKREQQIAETEKNRADAAEKEVQRLKERLEQLGIEP